MPTSLLQVEENSSTSTERKPIDLVSVKEAAKAVDRNETVIRYWINIEKLQSWKVGKKTCVSLQEVQNVERDSPRLQSSGDEDVPKSVHFLIDRQRQLETCQQILDRYAAKNQKRNQPNYDLRGLVGGAV